MSYGGASGAIRLVVVRRQRVAHKVREEEVQEPHVLEMHGAAWERDGSVARLIEPVARAACRVESR